MTYDISPVLEPGMPVWPGDSPFEMTWGLKLATGGSCNVSRLNISPHTGSHADAFYHCDDAGAAIGDMPLEPYLGPARVLDCPGDDPIDARRLESLDWQGARRLLFKTRTRPVTDPYELPFAHFAEDAVEILGQAGTLLVGLDTPSMDHREAKVLACHRALLRYGVANLELLDLAAVSAGDYELIALPLRMRGACGSPVRAVLRTLNP